MVIGAAATNKDSIRGLAGATEPMGCGWLSSQRVVFPRVSIVICAPRAALALDFAAAVATAIPSGDRATPWVAAIEGGTAVCASTKHDAITRIRAEKLL